MHDVRFALRQLLRSPSFTAVAVLTLALGIGATTAIFSVINATFLRPLPYPEPDRLVHLTESSRTGDLIPVAYPDFLDWQKQQDVFSSLAAFHDAEGRLKSRPDDDTPGAERVAWLTHEGWQRVFDGDPNLVGRSIDLDGRTLVIVGILPQGYRFYRQAVLVTALAPFAHEFFLDLRENHSNTEAVGRLKPGVTLEAARVHLDTIAARLAETHPEANKGVAVVVTSLRERLAAGSQAPLFLLLGAVGLVLLIACVNVANMLLARSLARGREMAIRSALGASRWQVLRQLLVESLVLAVLGSAAGALVGMWGFEFAVRLVPSEVRTLVDGGAFDGRMLLLLVGVFLVCGLVFGLVPAGQISKPNLVDALKHS